MKLRISHTMNKVKSMAETIGEALVLLQRLGGDVVDMSLDNNNPTEHNVLHKFKETMILPYYAVTNNCSLIMSKGDHYVTTADGIHCKVVSWEEKHICELEDEIQRLYNMDCWSYIKRWHRATKGRMDSMHFLILKLKKDE